MAENRQTSTMAPHAPHISHGNSVAAWSAVGLIMVGFLVMSIAVAVTTMWLFIVGVVIVVIGAISGKVLAMMGFGISGKPGA
ncbi:MAG TPA: HGxxPAAW family protein [Kineosporiaceae bacterium]|jgi:hypothetical protein|nr:HGxxPAAW family protein [Kineosporiaceae bacterium]